ncbi:PREDICTED: UDP-glycosyltransferase 83A1-like [Ipomoea nil]|uniref:UDP-glycosyltransferase 83A1-like n=1 Tax=Ipomoea nil TaxID=35883 RepID=UPI000901F0D2|nr:PREDICTED: UDP-glycosyltransferase 83A1-like [Ipomoea nil]
MGNPHILVIPYPAQGHVIPLMELAQCLARHGGINITFVLTQTTHSQILNSSALNNVALDDGIHLVSVLDASESNESSNVPGKLFEAISKIMPGKVEKLIRGINASSSESHITCVIADQSLGWALELAKKLGVQTAAFLPAAAANLVLGFNIPKLIDDGIINNEGIPAENKTFQFAPTMPFMNTSDFVWVRMGNLTLQRVVFQMMLGNNKSVKSADWLICNSAYDLEPGAFSLAPEILPIGPLLATKTLKTPTSSAGSFWPAEPNCLKFLDQHPPCSTIYAAFGSSTAFSEAQFEELAKGLELTNRPFLWVVKSDDANRKPNISERGMMVNWTPQQEVLSHPSLGCFLSHCGWNSTIESAINGVPILCWPYFADQFINQSYICDVWKIGLALKRDNNGSGIIKSEEIKNKVDQLLGDNSFKERALHLKEVTRANIAEGGSSHNNLMNFIKWINA